MELVHIYLIFLNKKKCLPISLHFFRFSPQIFPSCIRIRIQYRRENECESGSTALTETLMLAPAPYLLAGCVTVCPPYRCLYVAENEMVAMTQMTSSSRLELVGSEDATTCHLVLLLDRGSATAALAHLSRDTTYD